MTDIEFGFTRAREDATALMPYLNPLPRSVTGSEVFILLDGWWRFALDVEDRGLQERWYLGHTYSGTTEWPGSIETQMATGHDALASRSCRVQEVLLLPQKSFAEIVHHARAGHVVLAEALVG